MALKITLNLENRTLSTEDGSVKIDPSLDEVGRQHSQAFYLGYKNRDATMRDADKIYDFFSEHNYEGDHGVEVTEFEKYLNVSGDIDVDIIQSQKNL